MTRQLNTWLKASQLTPLETEHIGLVSLPPAFSGLLRGDNLGKTIVTLGT
jgi:NADPH-dependent curcumin reductase CurA